MKAQKTSEEYYLVVYQLSEESDIPYSSFESNEDKIKSNHERIRCVLGNKSLFPNAFQIMNTTWVIKSISHKDIFDKICNFFENIEESKIVIELIAKNIFYCGIDNEITLSKILENFGLESFKCYCSHQQIHISAHME